MEYTFKGTKAPLMAELAQEGTTIKVPQFGAYVVVADGAVKALCGIGLSEENKSNAHLIAAAPDLLEACILTLQSLEMHNLAPQSQHTLMQAIKKALNL